jgi:hypothetical protein
MLWQLHHQFKDGHTAFMAQREDPENNDELRKWIIVVQQSHPLPAGAMWLMCNEKSEYFIWGT